MTALDDDHLPPGDVRRAQENDIEFTHRLAEVEHALATDARIFARIFEDAGLEFDPLTCVVMTFVNECSDLEIDAVEVLVAFRDLGVLDRSVTLANEPCSDGEAS